MSTPWAVLAALALRLSVCTGEEAGNTNAVRFQDLPDAAQKALTVWSDGDALGEITKGSDSYLIQFTAEGKKQEFLVRKDLHCEGPRLIHSREAEGTAIQWGDLPQQVQTLVSSKFAGVSLDKILYRPGTYSARINRDGEAALIQFNESGRILSETPLRELREREANAERREHELRAKREAELKANAKQ